MFSIFIIYSEITKNLNVEEKDDTNYAMESSPLLQTRKDTNLGYNKEERGDGSENKSSFHEMYNLSDRPEEHMYQHQKVGK